MSSLFERDYILRIAKQLAALLAAILKLKQEKKYDQALEQLQGAFPSLFGIEYRTLVGVDSASAAQLLGEAAKIKTVARLLSEEADLFQSRGDDDRGTAKRAHALELYIESAIRDPRDPEISAAIHTLRGDVEASDLQEAYRAWLQLHGTAG